MKKKKEEKIIEQPLEFIPDEMSIEMVAVSSTPDMQPDEIPCAYHLIVKSQFRKYKKGDRITCRKEIEAIISCHEHSMTTKVSNKG